MDIMVLKSQQWMNDTYGGDSRYTKVAEDGATGWGTINGLIIALQIELGMAETAAVIGPTTRSKFNAKYPGGITRQAADDTDTDNVHSIIQCALWCKGYYAETGSITGYYKGQSADSVEELKADMGIGGNSTVTMEIMEALLSMKQFVLLSGYGGTEAIRGIQQTINKDYKNYTGIIPCDGLYGREMNTAIIQVLQAVEGFAPEVSNGNFGNGTKGALKVINATNAAANPDWVWIASVALICNGYLDNTEKKWATALQLAIETFQVAHALPITRQLDVNTWMSLFISKGNPDRAARACDTRFEVTDALAQKLKTDGYEIVGRYLTGGDFKEIREGELQRIISSGLKYFPIFQDNARTISEFTYENGKLHAKQAREAAVAKGVPSTVIYFAVDLDVMDYQVTGSIIPYFRGVSEHIGPLYKVGIYASRNTCTKVCNAGYAVSSFVSDMSTGYSGNLGFPIPKNWNYDQFHEISGYGGSWDLDKVAYSGKIAPCDKVVSYETPGYSLPDGPDLTKYAHTIFEVIELVKELEDAYNEYKAGKYKEYVPYGYTYYTKSVHIGVLNYLSKYYLRQIMFAAATQQLDQYFVAFMNAEHSELVKSVDAFVEKRENCEVRDNVGGLNDIAHLAYSTLAYASLSITPDYWASWGGDLASGMADIRAEILNDSKLEPQEVANDTIGSMMSQCNYIDLCDDADAIAISRAVKSSEASLRTLSSAMTEYYSDLSTAKRYSQYKYDGLDFSSSTLLYLSVYQKVCADNATALEILKGGATAEEQIAACKAFSEYLFRKVQ